MSESIEFEIIKEPWNKYKLEDSTIIKTRFILIHVVKEGVDESGGPIYNFNSDNVVGAVAPKELIGTPSNRTYTLEERMSSIEKELSFETIQEDWNEYKLADEVILKVKLVLIKVAKTSLRDGRGQPLYLVNNQPLFNFIIPKRSN